jgi:hypothetical protein
MIAMLDTPQDLDSCEDELGAQVEELFTPLTRRAPKRPDKCFAIDNGAFARFDTKLFQNELKKHFERRHLCRFVAVPDVVGSAIRTLEVFQHWWPELEEHWPLALVCQDGQESLPIPWEEIQAIFIGGSTDWKMSESAAQIVKAAKAIGKWVHVGRVNTPGRWEYFEQMGADSCDGTGLARYSHMRNAVSANNNEPRFDF